MSASLAPLSNFTQGGGGGGGAYVTTGTTSGGTLGSWLNITNTTSSTTFLSNSLTLQGLAPTLQSGVHFQPTRDIKVRTGRAFKIEMPNGAVMHVDKDGSYVFDDIDAKKKYKGHGVLEFNRYVNASDLLEEFIKYCSGLNVSSKEILELPVELFIKFIVVRAAEQDGEDYKQDSEQLQQGLLALPARFQIKPRCRQCRRFITHDRARQNIDFCSGAHLDRWTERARQLPGRDLVPLLQE